LVLVVLVVVGLVDLIRARHTMETWQVVVWAAMIVVVPVIGLVAYLFWRLFRSQAMQEEMDFEEEQPGMGQQLDSA
jgi:hypothetical protein